MAPGHLQAYHKKGWRSSNVSMTGSGPQNVGASDAANATARRSAQPDYVRVCPNPHHPKASHLTSQTGCTPPMSCGRCVKRIRTPCGIATAVGPTPLRDVKD